MRTFETASYQSIFMYCQQNLITYTDNNVITHYNFTHCVMVDNLSRNRNSDLQLKRLNYIQVDNYSDGLLVTKIIC